MEKLTSCYKELFKIKTNLVKDGPTRRQNKNTCDKKKNEANSIISKCNTYLASINLEKHKYKSDELLALDTLTNDIASIYEDIVKYCTQDVTNSVTMSKFDLKTAVSLLPVMDGKEEVTKQLISAIDMYSSMLDEASNKQLVTFILKTRLSEGAKLRMSQSYDTVTLLLADMRKNLLTKKSFTALQQQLQTASQNNRSIEVFGKEIETLFNELTISQADGDVAKYDILRPLNEQTAIRRFAEGLQNGHLSTIISARDYTSLKDAIRGAKDQAASTSSQASIMRMDHNNRFSRSRFSYRGRGRGNNRGSYYTHNNYQQRSQFVPSTYYQRGHPSRGYAPATRSQQGPTQRGYHIRHRGRYPRHNINYIEPSAQPDEQANINDRDHDHNLSQFFRQ